MLGSTGYRRRVGGAAPAPALTSASSVSEVGGVSSVAGTNFLAGDVINVDGVDALTLSGSTSPVNVPVPSHAAGTVNVTVKRAGVASAPVSLTYTFDPAYDNLSGYFEARDLSTVGPLVGRGSAGDSAAKRLIQQGGVVLSLNTDANGKKYLSGDQLCVALNSSPTVKRTQAEQYSLTGAFASIVITVDLQVINEPAPPYSQAGYGYPQLLGCNYDGAAYGYFGPKITMSRSDGGAGNTPVDVTKLTIYLGTGNVSDAASPNAAGVPIWNSAFYNGTIIKRIVPTTPTRLLAQFRYDSAVPVFEGRVIDLSTGVDSGWVAQPGVTSNPGNQWLSQVARVMSQGMAGGGNGDPLMRFYALHTSKLPISRARADLYKAYALDAANWG